MQQQHLRASASWCPASVRSLTPHTRLHRRYASPVARPIRWHAQEYRPAKFLAAAAACAPVRQSCRSVACRSTLEPEALPSDVKLEVDPDSAAKEVTYDEPNKTIRIPLAAINDGQRRTKMVMFTCNQCGGRSARLVNPVAWEKGAVFCQCQQCGVWHTLRAAKHIMEEVRYNDPGWQLEADQLDSTAAAAAAAAAAKAETDGSHRITDSQDSAQTVLELPSSNDQEATSAVSAAEQQQGADGR